MSARRSHTVKPIPDRAPPFWYALLLAALAGVLVPLDERAPLFAPALVEFDLAGYGDAVAQQVYLGIKAAMLWVPLGFLASLAGWDRALRRWVPAAVVLLALGLPALPDVSVGDALELLFALPGLALGLWLGQATREGGVLAGVVGDRRAEISARADHATASQAAASADESGAPAMAARASAAGLDVIQARREHVPRSRKRQSAGGEDLSPAGGNGHGAAPFHLSAEPGAMSISAASPAAALRLLAGLAVLLAVVVGLWDFPRWPVLLGLGLALYAVLLWFRPLAWLIAVPAALPLFDLAPWTGRYFLDEFDLLMLVTAAMLLLRGRFFAALAPRLAVLVLAGLLALSVLIAAARGVLPLAPLDANAFSSYWSGYNSLRVVKGFVWGALIYLWLRAAGLERRVLARHLAVGMGLGLLGVGLVGAWEHHLFVGFAERLDTYRIVSTFSSMHTGGGHIEAYLVSAVPFLWLATTRLKHLALTGPVLILIAYVMVYTVSRGGVLALGVVLLILLLASGRLALRAGGRRFLAPIGILLAVGMVVAAGMGGGYLQQRFATTGQDWQIRMDHWGQALEQRDPGVAARLFGTGLGTFPVRYLERGPVDKQPATFAFAVEQGDTFFRLGYGDTVYYAQRVNFSAGQTYRLELDARARQDNARIDTPVCEKQMLNSRQCAWMAFNVPGDGEWHRLTREFSSAEVGAQPWWRRPPVELSVHNPGSGGIVELDNLRLLDAQGRDLLCNGDFSAGGDCWFFKTHSHLPWHIKNVWVHLLFEQGWLGLLAFTGLTLLAMTRLARAGWRGHRLAWAWLASLAGMLTVGVFDSLLDAPRLAAWLIALLLLGAGWHWRDGGPSGQLRNTRGWRAEHRHDAESEPEPWPARE